ncbi:BatA domain-containing protein [Polaribacter sp.]|uniref:BatA domain-containing protein n=2 Tax=Polaribacter sp. TaxID=1920175 RepID=UPI004047CED2
MQFKNPEILYFLWLLIIPILVHLFQLQKFVKVPFTNVAFLQKIIQDSRKSSRLKKWLILATRMLLLSAILFTFSQPFFSDEKNTKSEKIILYIDNSLSTQAKGEKGFLLQNAAKEIIENAPQSTTYSLLTNNEFYDDISFSELKKLVLELDYSSKKPSLASVLLKIDALSKKQINTLNETILISDFQNTYNNVFTNVTPPFSVIKLFESQKNNISIDSVFTSNSLDETTLHVIVKNQGASKKNVPIALYNEKELSSKQSFSIEENATKTILFSIQKKKEFKGKINITFSDTFSFDNSFYFILKNDKKIDVLTIGNETDFMLKIYTKDEFNFIQNLPENINYNLLPKQDVLILYEIEKISEILSKSIQDFISKSGSVVIVPNPNSDINSYNQLLQKFSSSTFSSKNIDSLKITNINENHPFFKNVFSKKVENFQYPTVNHFYEINSKNDSKMVTFENNSSFLSQINIPSGALYVFTSAIDKKNSSFQNSPLIVPIFYNFGKFSFLQSQLHYYLDEENKIDVDIQLQKDEILEISNATSTFIPIQQTFQNKVTLTTNQNPTEAGFYTIKKNDEIIKTIAFNNPKEESLLQFLDVAQLEKTNPNITVSDTVSSVFKNIKKKNEVQSLWKWFLALAIVSLFLEILILKFYKP